MKLRKNSIRKAPADIKLKRADRILEINWGDDGARRYTIKKLRCECGCAGCVDEHTGVRTLDIESVSTNIEITHMELVGNYAIKLTFSDGHDTGIYSWDRLFRILPMNVEPDNDESR